MVRRYDSATLGKAIRTEAGFLRAPATLTRIGVFDYQQPDGSTRRELRLPEEVFAAGSLDSLQAAPLTLEHPKTAVTPDNARDLQVGSVGTDVHADGDYVRGTVMITAADAIAAVDSGRMEELSCGYNCTLEHVPGEWQGQPYDSIQRGITYNHLALVPAGRAGPGVRLHLDAADAVQIPQTQEPRMATRKIKIGKIRFDADEQIADSVEEEIAAKEAELAELKAQLEASKVDNEKLEAEKDSAEEAAEKAEEEKQDALKPERIRSLVQARVALETQARSVLGAETKLDEMSDGDIRKAVVSKFSPAAKLDGKSDVYIEARYDAAIESAKATPNTGLGAVRMHADAAGGASHLDASARRDAMVSGSRDAWKQPLMKGAK